MRQQLPQRSRSAPKLDGRAWPALALAGALALSTFGASGCQAAASGAPARAASRPAVAAVVSPGGDRVPAHAYASLDAETCARELWERRIPFAYVDVARGVNAPIRLTGPIRGVDFHGEPKSQRGTSVHEILDCRLALALDDFAKILADHEIVEAVHMSMYRPPPAHIKDPTKRRSKHEAALAIDIGSLVRRDGTRLAIQKDWNGRIGSRTCGSGAGPTLLTGNAIELRSILCETADAQMFHLVLTPNNDAKHYNHFHLEVVRGVKWFILK